MPRPTPTSARRALIFTTLPATLHRVAGAASEVFLTWLTPAQLACMHASEGVGRIDAAGAYVGRNGALVDGPGPVRLAAVPAQGCALPASTQPLMLRAAHARLAPTWPYRRFMGRILRSLRYRAHASTALARSAIRWATADAP